MAVLYQINRKTLTLAELQFSLSFNSRGAAILDEFQLKSKHQANIIRSIKKKTNMCQKNYGIEWITALGFISFL